jgi:hypothetical protein
MRLIFAAALLVVLAACSTTVAGTPTWPGERLEHVTLTATDFPQGVQYDRLIEDPAQPDGAGGPPGMLSKPPDCTNALTNVIAKSAERGPGSAAKYSVGYDGVRIVMTVLSWHLDLDQLAAAAARCERFMTYFDPASAGIPMTTTKLPSSEGELVYQQTLLLAGQESSIYMSFANVGPMAVFGLALPFANSTIPVKGSLPQTFLDIASKQAGRIRAA